MTVAKRGSGRPSGGRYGPGIISASTLASWYGSSYQLVKWAKRTFYDGALEGKTFEELDERDLEIGTVVHKIIEAEVHGEEWPVIPEEHEEPIQFAYSAWKKWLDGRKLTVVATEVAIVSEKHRLGGTLDAVLQDDAGDFYIGDWKTSKTLRSSYLVQLAIYGLLWEEENDRFLSGYHLLRFGKTGKSYDDKFYADLDTARDFALYLREAYEMAKEVKKESGLAF